MYYYWEYESAIMENITHRLLKNEEERGYHRIHHSHHKGFLVNENESGIYGPRIILFVVPAAV